MRFKRIEIKNYRSLEDATVDLDGLTILIGANNAGKTTILDALGLFGDSVRRIGAGDFNDRDRPVELALTMSCKEGEMGIPARFCIDGEFTVKKRFYLSDGRVALDTLARVMLNSDFGRLRRYMLKSEIKAEIRRLKQDYSDIPGYGRGGKAKWLEKFEEYNHGFYLAHPGHPKVREEYVTWDVHEAPLEHMLDIIYVPSMRDIANDGEASSGSYLARLIAMAIEDSQGRGSDLSAAAGTCVSDYEEYVRVVRGGVIGEINASLAKNSGRYAAGSSITVDVVPPERVLPSPVPSISIGEGGRAINIGQAGGGTRRVYLMALLETISEIQGRALGGGHASRARLLIIDEPELYQHPQRQRKMLLALVGLAGDGPVQAICSTHSPYFIDLKQIAGLRLVKKGRPTKILRTTIDRLMRQVLGPEKSKLPNGPDELRTWLDMNATHWMTEGFFSKTAVIVEGPGDRNMLLATASAIGADLDRHEISMVPTNGKPKIPHVMRLFIQFKIPTYVVWDLDYRPGSQPGAAQRVRNAGIMKLASGRNDPEYKDLEKTEINGEFSCFGDNLPAALVGDLDKCKELLNGMSEYAELQEAKRLDASSTDQKTYMRHQKHVLNSKETVFNMLKAIRDKDPDRLKTFATVRVVRQLEAVGEKNAMEA